MKAAKIHAAMEGRAYVIPDDIKELCGPVLAHRIVTGFASGGVGNGSALLGEILAVLPAPKE